MWCWRGWGGWAGHDYDLWLLLLVHSCPGDKHMKVTEVMGEGRFSFSIPMQLL